MAEAVERDMDQVWSRLFDAMLIGTQGEGQHSLSKLTELNEGICDNIPLSREYELERVRTTLRMLKTRRQRFVGNAVDRLESILLLKAKVISSCQTHMVTRKERLREQNIVSEERLRDLLMEVYGEYGKSAIRCVRRGDFVENMRTLNMVWAVHKLRWERFMLRLYREAQEDGDLTAATRPVQHTVLCAKSNREEFSNVSLKARRLARGMARNNNKSEKPSTGGVGGGGANIGTKVATDGEADNWQVMSIIRINKTNQSAENYPRQPKLFKTRLEMFELLDCVKQLFPPKPRAPTAAASNSEGTAGGAAKSRHRAINPELMAQIDSQLANSNYISPKSRLGRLSRFLKCMNINWMHPSSLNYFYSSSGIRGASDVPLTSRKSESEVVSAEYTDNSAKTASSNIVGSAINNIMSMFGGNSSSNGGQNTSSGGSQTPGKLERRPTSYSDYNGETYLIPPTNGNLAPIIKDSFRNRGFPQVTMSHIVELESELKRQHASSNIAWDRIYYCLEERILACKSHSLSPKASISCPADSKMSEDDVDGFTMILLLEIIQSEICSSSEKLQLGAVRDALSNLRAKRGARIEVAPFPRAKVDKASVTKLIPNTFGADIKESVAEKVLFLLKCFPDIVKVQVPGSNFALHFSVATAATLAELKNSFSNPKAKGGEIHGIPRSQFVSQCFHPWISMLNSDDSYLLDSLYFVTAGEESSGVEYSYTLEPLHGTGILEIAKHALVSENSRLASMDTSPVHNLMNFTLLTPDTARCRLSTLDDNKDFMLHSQLNLASVEKFVTNEMYHKYILFPDEFVPSSSKSNKATSQKCMYLVQLYDETTSNKELSPCSIETHVLRAAISLRNIQSSVSASKPTLGGSDSVRKLATMSDADSASPASESSSSKDWDKSIISTVCRWRSCACEAMSATPADSQKKGSHQIPPLCYYHFELKSFMDSSADRAFGDSSSYLPKKAPAIPKNITVDSLTKYEIIANNMNLDGGTNIISTNGSVAESISGNIHEEPSENGDPSANEEGSDGKTRADKARGNTATAPGNPGAVIKNSSKILPERSRDMYIIRAASSLLQELWNGKLKGTLQIFMKKVVSELGMKQRLESKYSSYKSLMNFMLSRFVKLQHPLESTIYLAQQLSPTKTKGGQKTNTKNSPRGNQKTVLFQPTTSSRLMTLPPVPKWSCWKQPKLAASVIESQLELERDYVELLRIETEVMEELKQYLNFRQYPTTEVNIIRKEQKVLKETIDFNVESGKMLPLSHIAAHYNSGTSDANSDAQSNEALNSYGPSTLANPMYYQSLKLLASLESGMAQKKTYILMQKRVELAENAERSAIQAQKIQQAQNKLKKGGGNTTNTSSSANSARPRDPAVFSNQSRF